MALLCTRALLSPLLMFDFLPIPCFLLAASSLSFKSISLVGGNLGKLDGSQANGSVVKNWPKTAYQDQVKTLKIITRSNEY